MEKKTAITKFLAIAGTALVWFPLAAPVLISAIFYLQDRIFRIDYLMPAELFFFFLFGSGLLLWAGLRARSHIRPVAWGIGIALLMLVGGQWLAVTTGLASGETEPTGLAWMAVIASLVVYVLGILLVGMGGILLLRDLFKTRLPAV